MINSKFITSADRFILNAMIVGVLMLGNSGLAAEQSKSEMTNSDQVISYDRRAKTELSPNDIQAFVYQWFAYFDHQVEPDRITKHLGYQVDMAFPDFPIRSKADLDRWYQGVIENIQWNSHEISNLKVTGNHASGWNVSLDVRWRARTYDGQQYDQLIHQDWQLTADDDGNIRFKRHRARPADESVSTDGMKRNEDNIMNRELAERNKTSVRAFFKALEAEDAEQVIALFAEDAVHINPYHSGVFPEGAKGKEGIRAYWTPVFPNFDGMQFPIHEIYAMENPDMVFVRYSGKIKLKNDAGWYENNYYSTFKFNDKGEILEYVEIFNPITAARDFGLLEKIVQQ